MPIFQNSNSEDYVEVDGVSLIQKLNNHVDTKIILKMPKFVEMTIVTVFNTNIQIELKQFYMLII